MLNIYLQNGFSSRDEYLLDLFDNLGVPYDVGYALAQLLGPEEDFDGLVTGLEDWAQGNGNG